MKFKLTAEYTFTFLNALFVTAAFIFCQMSNTDGPEQRDSL